MPGRRGKPSGGGGDELGNATRPWRCSRLAAAHELGDARNGTEVGRRPEPEHRRSTPAHERQKPFRRRRRRCQRLRDRHAEAVVGRQPTPDDFEIRQPLAPALEEINLPPFGFNQGDLAVGKRSRERDPRRASPEPTSTIGPSSPRTTPTPRRLSSSSIRRASAGSRIEVSPAVSRTASSPVLKDWEGDDEAIRLGPPRWSSRLRRRP